MIEQKNIDLQIDNLSKFLSKFLIFFNHNRFFVKEISREQIKKDIEEKTFNLLESIFNLKINIYPGADAEFTLYEDENDNYNYEKGAYSEIKFVWDNNKQQLTIEKRQGKFEGMIKNRSFQLHKETAETTKTTKKITYKGDKMVIAF